LGTGLGVYGVSGAHGGLVLSGLSQGEHTVEIRVKVTGFILGEGNYETNLDPVSVNFFVGNPNSAPEVAIVSLEKHETNQATVTISTDVPNSIVSYSLDGKKNITLPHNEAAPTQNGYQYNVTLPNLTEGTHNLKAYAKDSFDNTGIAQKEFKINTESTQPIAPISTTALILGGAIAGAVIVCVAFVVIFRSQKIKLSNNSKK
jgi:hypothetical protein